MDGRPKKLARQIGAMSTMPISDRPLAKPYDCSTSKRGAASVVPRGRPQMTRPDPELPKELDGDHPFLVASWARLGSAAGFVGFANRGLSVCFATERLWSGSIRRLFLVDWREDGVKCCLLKLVERLGLNASMSLPSMTAIGSVRTRAPLRRSAARRASSFQTTPRSLSSRRASTSRRSTGLMPRWRPITAPPCCRHGHGGRATRPRSKPACSPERVTDSDLQEELSIADHVQPSALPQPRI